MLPREPLKVAFRVLGPKDQLLLGIEFPAGSPPAAQRSGQYVLEQLMLESGNSIPIELKSKVAEAPVSTPSKARQNRPKTTTGDAPGRAAKRSTTSRA